ncbi:Ribosomal RNA small subunit methyltransferase I [Candidatus Clavichlamydia salmonicola]|uniref:SAM-dependent methyltransferase n=1 Tax=Candidatus Clavichlamydia salmonicola TaxID=469812 RepID=UPI001891AF5B|nr:SAM-dependent methyltransferase [Candidatus Clavichlamydia salmonicola]MBF5051391.1 Ribosomal RNA small subunit methyltransferase I [Candidatus Clavichlamydia salmonicola]
MLHLLPNTLGHPSADIFSPLVIKAVESLKGVIAESHRGGRLFLSLTGCPEPQKVPLALIPKRQTEKELDFLIEPLLKGEDWGLVSDAGLPCLADPGRMIVTHARKHGIAVKAYPGPCSITWALMLSGFPAQKFVFHGYLSRNPLQREKELISFEKEILRTSCTQVFIEAPYRNLHLLKTCLKVLSPKMSLSISVSLSCPDEDVRTDLVSVWQKEKESTLIDFLQKRPAVFILGTVS